jgi:hypothetical protein
MGHPTRRIFAVMDECLPLPLSLRLRRNLWKKQFNLGMGLREGEMYKKSRLKT